MTAAELGKWVNIITVALLPVAILIGWLCANHTIKKIEREAYAEILDTKEGLK